MNISEISEIEKLIDIMKDKGVPFLKVGDVEIHRPDVPFLNTEPIKPRKPLTTEQHKQVYEAELLGHPIPTFDNE